MLHVDLDPSNFKLCKNLSTKILCSSDKEEECLAAIGEEFADKSYLTVFYGESIDEERAQKAVAVLQEKVGSMTEIALLRGGQPIYDYIISAE